MIKEPQISKSLAKKHTGETYIALNGKIIAFGKTGIDALKKAKKIMPDIEKEEFLIARIYPKYVVA